MTLANHKLRLYFPFVNVTKKKVPENSQRFNGGQLIYFAQLLNVIISQDKRLQIGQALLQIGTHVPYLYLIFVKKK